MADKKAFEMIKAMDPDVRDNFLALLKAEKRKKDLPELTKKATAKVQERNELIETWDALESPDIDAYQKAREESGNVRKRLRKHREENKDKAAVKKLFEIEGQIKANGKKRTALEKERNLSKIKQPLFPRTKKSKNDAEDEDDNADDKNAPGSDEDDEY
jgi:hypothetical protein